MPNLDKIYLYRMTHIENVPHILQYGITHSTSPNANPAFVPIGDGSLIRTRSNFRLDCGRRLGDYIPLCFGVRMPMLYVIQKGYNFVTHTPARDIVYCVTSVGKIMAQKLDFVFTDGHAVDSFTTQYGVADITSIDTLLDKKAIDAKYWKDENDLDLKRRKEAEFLVMGDIAAAAIINYSVINHHAKARLEAYGVNEDKIQVQPQYYF
jgi:hypothetical protein